MSPRLARRRWRWSPMDLVLGAVVAVVVYALVRFVARLTLPQDRIRAVATVVVVATVLWGVFWLANELGSRK